jgi:hypothetical protein
MRPLPPPPRRVTWALIKLNADNVVLSLYIFGPTSIVLWLAALWAQGNATNRRGEPDAGAVFALAVVGTITTIGTLVSVLMLLRLRSLLQNGTASLGTVTASRIKRQNKHGTVREITMTYDVDGVSTKGVYTTTTAPPEIGSELWVLYDPRKATRIAVAPPSISSTSEDA